MLKDLYIRRLLIRVMLGGIFYFSMVGWIFEKGIAGKNKEGKRLYDEAKFDEALSKWRDAQIKNPENEKLHYNIGGALHEQQKYEETFNEYEKALDSKDTELQGKTYYNIGNTHYRMGKLPEAIEDYEKCLEINPDDEDAKYNIEFIKKKLKEKKEKAQQEKSEAQKTESQQQDSQPSQASKEEKQLAPDKEKEEESSEEKANHERRTTNDEKEMSKEDAIRLLDALKDDERDLQRELRRAPIEGRYRVDRDW